MDFISLFAPQEWLFLTFSLAVLGCMAGFMAGLLGVGGGIVLVPGMLFIFESLGLASSSLIHVCVGTSLALIVPNGLMSARAHYNKGAVDFHLVKIIGVGILIGVVIGTWIADGLSGEKLQAVFAVAVIVLALLMIINPSRFSPIKKMPPFPWSGFVGIGIGGVSSLIGIGGGSLSVPFMSLCNVAIHRAIGTAAALGVVIAVPGALGFIYIGLNETGRPPFSFGYINILAWILILPTSLLFVRFGVAAAHKISVTIMRRVFAIFLCIVAVKMIADTFL